MISDRSLYNLSFADVTAHIVANGTWWMQEMGKTWCKNCRILRREIYPQPVDVCVERIPVRNPIGFVSRAPIGVIRNDLRDALEPWLKGFVFGRCVDDDGAPIATHSTFYSCAYVHERGGPKSVFRLCSQCGVVCSRSFTPPEHYLASEVRDEPLVQSVICTTLVSKELRDTLRSKAIVGLRMRKVPVLDRPLDGWQFPNDPTEWGGKPLERM